VHELVIIETGHIDARFEHDVRSSGLRCSVIGLITKQISFL